MRLWEAVREPTCVRSWPAFLMRLGCEWICLTDRQSHQTWVGCCALAASSPSLGGTEPRGSPWDPATCSSPPQPLLPAVTNGEFLKEVRGASCQYSELANDKIKPTHWLVVKTIIPITHLVYIKQQRKSSPVWPKHFIEYLLLKTSHSATEIIFPQRTEPLRPLSAGGTLQLRLWPHS